MIFFTHPPVMPCIIKSGGTCFKTLSCNTPALFHVLILGCLVSFALVMASKISAFAVLTRIFPHVSQSFLLPSGNIPDPALSLQIPAQYSRRQSSCNSVALFINTALPLLHEMLRLDTSMGHLQKCLPFQILRLPGYATPWRLRGIRKTPRLPQSCPGLFYCPG